MLHTYFTLTGTLLGRYCGSSIPNSIDTSSNVALVRFVTDGSLSASGFRLRFDSSLECKFVDSLKKYTHTHTHTHTHIYHVAAAAAKSLQSCPTLCDPIDGSPSGSLVPGILQARTLEWVAISFSYA